MNFPEPIAVISDIGEFELREERLSLSKLVAENSAIIKEYVPAEISLVIKGIPGVAR